MGRDGIPGRQNGLSARERDVVGVFGGSFNPPHVGHVLACHFALVAWGLQRVIVVPSYAHPFGKTLEDFEHRLEMAQLAFKHLHEYVIISDVERQLGGVGYTVDMLQELRRLHPDTEFRLLVGSDILEEIPQWHRFDEISRVSPLMVIPRSGHTSSFESGLFLPEISSRDIRQRLFNGEDPGPALPASVMGYIRERKLYGFSVSLDTSS